MQTSIPVYSSTIMNLSMVAFRYICFLAFLVCILSPTVKSQIQGCLIQDMDLGLCLNQANINLSINSICCKVLNKVVQTGYNCLCLLVASSLPLLSAPLVLPLSNCYISVPPLTSCRGNSGSQPLPFLNFVIKYMLISFSSSLL